jgi:hypothetical protein
LQIWKEEYNTKIDIALVFLQMKLTRSTHLIKEAIMDEQSFETNLHPTRRHVTDFFPDEGVVEDVGICDRMRASMQSTLPAKVEIIKCSHLGESNLQ